MFYNFIVEVEDFGNPTDWQLEEQKQIEEAITAGLGYVDLIEIFDDGWTIDSSIIRIAIEKGWDSQYFKNDNTYNEIDENGKEDISVIEDYLEERDDIVNYAMCYICNDMRIVQPYVLVYMENSFDFKSLRKFQTQEEANQVMREEYEKTVREYTGEVQNETGKTCFTDDYAEAKGKRWLLYKVDC